MKKGTPPLGREECLAMRRLCLSASLRRTERLVTRHYDAHLSGAGVTAVQLPILAAIAASREQSFRQLAETLELDRSTLSRNLALLQRRGLVAIGPSAGPKAGTIALTAAGRAALRRAYRLWLAAHRKLEASLPKDGVAEGLRLLNRLRSAVRDGGAR
jgi:DNA-binding MarR family transcriptional regulator